MRLRSSPFVSEPRMTEPSSPTTTPPADSPIARFLKSRFAKACVITGLVVLVIIGWTWSVGGKGLADRALTDLAMPLGAIWLLLFLVAVTFAIGRQWRIALAIFALWTLFSAAGSRPIGGLVRQSVEYPAETNPADTIESPLDAIVLLGGYAWVNQFEVPELGSDGQRFLFAAQLWHSGKTRSIICTGTAHYGSNHPSKLGRELLRSVGVPDEVIFESPGENTSQEMAGLREYFDAPPAQWLALVGRDREPPIDEPRVGLITSAMHLPRALRLADTQQLTFVPLPCCFSGSADEPFVPRDLIPAASGAKSIASGLKEKLAILVGR